jgi:hypothetical protein
VLVEGDVTSIVASGVSNALSINGNGCDGFPAGTGVENTCSSSTSTVMVTSTQACTSSTQSSVCTSEFSSSGSSTTKSCSCVGVPSGDSPTKAPTSAAGARIDRVLVAMVSGVMGMMAFLLF